MLTETDEYTIRMLAFMIEAKMARKEDLTTEDIKELKDKIYNKELIKAFANELYTREIAKKEIETILHRIEIE